MEVEARQTAILGHPVIAEELLAEGVGRGRKGAGVGSEAGAADLQGATGRDLLLDILHKRNESASRTFRASFQQVY